MHAVRHADNETAACSSDWALEGRRLLSSRRFSVSVSWITGTINQSSITFYSPKWKVT